jgi:hypothetical protein
MTDDKLDIKTFSLEEVAAMVLPPDMTNGVRWLSHRLNRGELSGYRVGRTWRMTHADVEDLIERRTSKEEAICHAHINANRARAHVERR